MSGPADEVRKVLCLLVEHYLAADDLFLYLFGEVIQHGFVDLGGAGLEEEVLVLEDGRPVGHVLVFLRPEQPDPVEPSQLFALRRLVDVGLLSGKWSTSRSLLSERVSSIMLGSFLTLFRIHSDVEMSVEEW